jgi:hypothetical protein
MSGNDNAGPTNRNRNPPPGRSDRGLGQGNRFGKRRPFGKRIALTAIRSLIMLCRTDTVRSRPRAFAKSADSRLKASGTLTPDGKKRKEKTMAEAKSCPNTELNNQGCNCDNYDCANHGICCRCVLSHRNKDHLPACLRHFEK